MSACWRCPNFCFWRGSAAKQDEVVFVNHWLTPEIRRLLVDSVMGAVINQNPQAALIDCD